MPTTLEQLATLLRQANLRFHLDEDKGVILSGFATHLYQDRDGDQGVGLVLSLAEGGDLLTIAAPFCYVADNPAHHRSVQVACSLATARFRFVRFVFDPTDGEVTLMVDHAVMDSQLTERQLVSLMSAFPSIVDLVDDMFRLAIATGEVTAPLDPRDLAREFAEFLSQRRPVPVPALGLEE
jgi:hypothetical protein